MINRLDAALARRSPALVCYVPLGDPELPPELARAFVDAGADVLELGMPVADPYLDGPIVATSMTRAAATGLDARASAAAIAELRRELPDQALVWMTYPEALARVDADLVAASGADGVLAPLAGPELDPLADALHARGVHFLRFVSAPSRPREVAAARSATGYVMVQAAAGVTGPRPDVAPGLRHRIRRLRAAGVTAPLALGFGIATPAAARTVVHAGADAVIVGSALLAAARQGTAAAAALVSDIRHAIDTV